MRKTLPPLNAKLPAAGTIASNNGTLYQSDASTFCSTESPDARGDRRSSVDDLNENDRVSADEESVRTEFALKSLSRCRPEGAGDGESGACGK